MLGYRGRRNHTVYLSLWYSRMITSEEDYRAFYGAPITEEHITRADFQFDPMIAAEIESLQPLPEPIHKAYARCKASSVSQKIKLSCVMRVACNQRYQEIVRGNLSLPAIMIGDAAHGIPESCSPDSINDTIWDATVLGRMIIERYDDDSAFATLPTDFYGRQRGAWACLPRRWAEKWMKAHGFDISKLHGWNGFSFAHKDYWEKQSEPGRFSNHKLQCEAESKDMKFAITRYKEHEVDRWKKILERKNASRIRRVAYKRKLEIQSTEIVVRYLDSRDREGKHNGDHQSQKEGSSTQRPEISSPRPHGHS